MHWVYAALRFYPFWALPLAFLVGEIAWFYHRKKRRIQYLFWVISFLVGISGIIWVVFRGDRFSDQWIQRAIEMRSK